MGAVRYGATRGNVLRHIEALEARSMDASRLVPHSPEWVAFWDQQAYNHAIGKESLLFPLDAMRAVLQYTDDPASLLGQFCRESEAAVGELAPTCSQDNSYR